MVEFSKLYQPPLSVHNEHHLHNICAMKIVVVLNTGPVPSLNFIHKSNHFLLIVLLINCWLSWQRSDQMECEQCESIASTNIVLKIKNVEIQGQCIRKQTLVFQEICFNTVNIALHFVCHLEPYKLRGIL